MRFDGSLGNVQIASDFRVVTSLKKQIYDLPFPGTHLVELFFHKDCTWPMRPGLLQVAKQSGLPHIWIRAFASHFAFTRPNRARDVN
jgi:hypothetical protein